jgi:hypothetical protein
VAGGKQLETGDTTLLGKSVIHAVQNPLHVFTGAIHIYGGDFFGTPRSDWDPETLKERPYDVVRPAAHRGCKRAMACRAREGGRLLAVVVHRQLFASLRSGRPIQRPPPSKERERDCAMQTIRFDGRTSRSSARWVPWPALLITRAVAFRIRRTRP